MGRPARPRPAVRVQRGPHGRAARYGGRPPVRRGAGGPRRGPAPPLRTGRRSSVERAGDRDDGPSRVVPRSPTGASSTGSGWRSDPPPRVAVRSGHRARGTDGTPKACRAFSRLFIPPPSLARRRLEGSGRSMESTQSGWWRRHGWTLAILLSAFGLTFAVRTIWEYPVIAQWGPLFTYAGGSDSVLPLARDELHHSEPSEPDRGPDAPVPDRSGQPSRAAVRLDERPPGDALRPRVRRKRRHRRSVVPRPPGSPLGRARSVSHLPDRPRGQRSPHGSDRRTHLPVPECEHRFLHVRLRELSHVLHVLRPSGRVRLPPYGEGGRHATVHRKLREAQPVHPRHPRLPTDRTHCREVERLHGCLPGGARPGVAGLHVRRGRDRRRRPHRDAGRADPEGRLVRPLLLDVDRRAGRLPDGRTLLLRSGRPAAILRRSDPPVLRNVGHPPSVPPDAGHTLGLLDPGADPVRRRCGDPPQGGLPPVLHRRDHGARLLRQEPRLLDDRGSPGTVHRFARDRLRGHHVLPRVRGRCPVRVPPGPAPVQAVPPRLPRLRHSLDLPPHLGVEVLRYRFAGVRSPFRRSGPSRPRRGGLPRPPTDGGLAHRHAEPRGRVPQGVQSEARPRPGPGRRDLAPERLDIDRRGDPRQHEERDRRPGQQHHPSVVEAQRVGPRGQRLRGRGIVPGNPEPVR